MKRISGLGLAVLLFATRSAISQTTTGSVTRDPQAVSSLQAALAAIGGNSQPTPSSIVASGTYTQYLATSTVSSPLSVEVLGSDKFRWEVDTADQGAIVTIVSGITGWRQTSQEVDAIPIGQIPGTTFEGFPALALSTWANSSSISATTVGPETIAGQNVLHISLTPTIPGNTNSHLETVYESTQQRELYLDQQTYLPVRVRYYAHPTDSRLSIPVDLALSDFRPVNGIFFPFNITRYMQGQKIATVQYDSMILNATVNPADFSAEVTP